MTENTFIFLLNYVYLAFFLSQIFCRGAVACLPFPAEQEEESESFLQFYITFMPHCRCNNANCCTFYH